MSAKTKETPKAITPKALAEELNVDPKRVRSFLRSEFTRPGEAKNTSWLLDQETADAVRARFTPKSEESDES